MNVAYRTTLMGVTTIVASGDPAAVKWYMLHRAKIAGYRCCIEDVGVERAPEHDEWAAVDATGVPWDESKLLKPKEPTT